MLCLPCKRNSFSGNTFLKTAVTKDDVGVVVEELVAGTVVGGGKVSLSSGETNGVGDTWNFIRV